MMQKWRDDIKADLLELKQFDRQFPDYHSGMLYYQKTERVRRLFEQPDGRRREKSA